ncbi:probable DNA double-strand break repair Rad50 ATPase isoform X2 [Magallana gigas]|uniref:probable DNA double-strand break repair Rad50 ATPase isoform X2 n=1 Tax=Magallana gigas TaxID=29159 RepID=UPI003342BEA9
MSEYLDPEDETHILGMEGAGTNSPESVLGQITAFEKLLRHAISRFSKERLYSMLQVAADEQRAANPSLPRGAKTAAEAKKPSTAPTLKLKSMDQLRQSLKPLMKREEKNVKLSDKERQALKHLETFENDYKYLGNLKRHFDDNIHSVLLKDYFDPADRPRRSALKDRATDSNDKKVTPPSKNIKGKNSKRGSRPTEEETKTAEMQKLFAIVTQLEELERKWAGLLKDRELNPDDFDPDSSHELMTFSNYSAFEPLLRLVPDAFVKCYNAIDMAKEWLNLAKSIYGDRLPLKSRVKEQLPKSRENTLSKSREPSMVSQSRESTVSPKEPPPKTPEAPKKQPSPDPEERMKVANEYAQQAKEIKQNIRDIGEVIHENEIKLETLNEEMQSLESREGRIDELTNNFEQVDSKLLHAQKEYNTFLYERQRTMENLNNVRRGSEEHGELVHRANEFNAELTKRQSALKILEYKKNVVQEDYLLELELRPNFIHFLGDMKQQIDDIKTVIKGKQTEKQELEKQLALLKTNTEKIKQQMQRYIESSEDSENLTRQLSRLTKEIEDDLNSIEGMESERSFVSESDDVDLSEYITGFKPNTPSVKGNNSSNTKRDQVTYHIQSRTKQSVKT